MAKNNEKIVVQLASPERKYVKTYHDFLNNSFLTVEEQMIFIVLKSFIDFKDDSGEVFPSMETICKMAKMGEKRVRKNIKSLEEKGIVKKIRRGLSKTNIYTIADYPTMWTCNNIEDIAAIANNQGVKPMTAAEHIAELEKMGYTVQIKEKELVSDTDQSTETSTKNNVYIDKDSTKEVKSQAERYTLDQIQQHYEYDIMVQDNPEQQSDIDSVMELLHTYLNTKKQTIWIAGEDKPAEIVASKLLKLTHMEIMYCIDKYLQQDSRIKNPTSYMLTLLYSAREQMELDVANQVQHDIAHNALSGKQYLENPK